MRTQDNARNDDDRSARVQARRPEKPGAEALAGGMALQRTAGNAAVVQMLRRAGHPPALDHEHGDGCGHQEETAPTADTAVQRRADAPVQRRSAVHDVLRTGGRSLGGTERADMEARLGADFSAVRVHTDAAAKASAAEMGARAYTSGNHIVIGDGGGDRHTLAHELTHVIQQRQGPVAGTDNGSGLRVSDPSDRFEREAEANATRVMSGPRPQTDVARSVDHRASGGDGHVQRAVDVQRVEGDKQLEIEGGAEGPTTVRSASDLLVWLIGHPVSPAPRNYATPATLQRVLARLERSGGPIDHAAVWQALREVVAQQEADDSSDSSSSSSDSEGGGGFFRQGNRRTDDSSSEESSSDEESERSSVASSGSRSGADWAEGEWGVDEFGIPGTPKEFRRELDGDTVAERQKELAASLSGYRLVGFHGTHVESVGSLVTHGPDTGMVGKGSGLGKGRGFYVAPVVAPASQKAQGTTDAKQNAKIWGPFLVAVYVKDDIGLVAGAGGSDGGVEFESDSDSGSASGAGATMVAYGSDELVIPEELFGSVKLVRNVDDVSMASDPGVAAVGYEDGVSQYDKSKAKSKK
ncbi:MULTISPECIES: DUF4157 domain-containing protein [Streptomyces]|uniref:eCIS core domain-containing protein n=1 Tax=Streptomyces TaxID=1883 RepID=UPI001F31E793|nr:MULTISPECIES: DUF4157 domain-containing protein [Streptomyces]